MTKAWLICGVVAWAGCDSSSGSVTGGDMSAAAAGDMAQAPGDDLATAPPTDDSGAPPMITDDSGMPIPMTCTVNGAACSPGTDKFLCLDGACTPCTDVTDDATCKTAYGNGFLCISGACVPADCRTSTDCSGGKQCNGTTCVGCTGDADCTDPTKPICDLTTTKTCVAATQCTAIAEGMACPVNSADKCCGSGASAVCGAVDCCTNAQCTDPANPTCIAGTCNPASCAAPTDHIYYVDPTATKVGTGSMACPARSLSNILNHVGAEATTNPVTVNVLAGTVDSTKNTFPLHVPSNVTVHGSTTGITLIAVPTSTNYGLLFNTANTGETGAKNLTIRQVKGVSIAGTVTVGVQIIGGTTGHNIRLNHLSIGVPVGSISLTGYMGFTDGISVSTNAAYARIEDGMSVTGNQYGLNIANAQVTISVATSTMDTTAFDSNTYGIYMKGTMSNLFITGATKAGSKTVTANSNTVAGVYIGSTGSIASSIDGLAANNSTQTFAGLAFPGHGMTIVPGSKVKVRNSLFEGSMGNGIYIPSASTFAGGIDLGKAYATDPGKNTFKGNGLSGVCFIITSDGAKLAAQGNTFIHGASTSIDCALPTPPTTALKYGDTAPCSSGVDFTTSTRGIDLSNCTAFTM